jgi:hypothetical protein
VPYVLATQAGAHPNRDGKANGSVRQSSSTIPQDLDMKKKNRLPGQLQDQSKNETQDRDRINDLAQAMGDKILCTSCFSSNTVYLELVHSITEMYGGA